MFLGDEKVLSTKEDGGTLEVTLKSGVQKMPKELFEAVKSDKKIPYEKLAVRKYKYIASVVYAALMKYGITTLEVQAVISELDLAMHKTLHKMVLESFGKYTSELDSYKEVLTLKELYDKAYT